MATGTSPRAARGGACMLARLQLQLRLAAPAQAGAVLTMLPPVRRRGAGQLSRVARRRGNRAGVWSPRWFDGHRDLRGDVGEGAGHEVLDDGHVFAGHGYRGDHLNGDHDYTGRSRACPQAGSRSGRYPLMGTTERPASGHGRARKNVVPLADFTIAVAVARPQHAS